MVTQINYLNRNYIVNKNQNVDIPCEECRKTFEVALSSMQSYLYIEHNYVFICNDCQDKRARLVLIKQLKEQKLKEQNKTIIEQQNMWKNNSFVLNTEYIQYE